MPELEINYLLFTVLLLPLVGRPLKQIDAAGPLVNQTESNLQHYVATGRPKKPNPATDRVPKQLSLAGQRSKNATFVSQ
jgi:hypothetical protein